MSGKIKNSRKKAMLKGGVEKKLPDFDILGDVSSAGYKLELTTALNYTTYMFDAKDCKTFASEYAKEHLDITFSNIPEYEFRHLGGLCWLLSNGLKISTLEEIHMQLNELVTKHTKEKNSKVSAVTPTKQSAVQIKTGLLIAELEGIIDDVYLGKKDIVNPSQWFDHFKPFNITQVRMHFENQANDLPKEDELPILKNKRNSSAISCIITQLAEFENTNKKDKKIHAPKPKKIVPAKMVLKLKYKKKDDEYSIKSIHPTKIIMADALWVFNTTSRRMSHYVAQDKVGLLVKGTTVHNYDQEKSCEKLLRKPAEFLKKLESSGKVSQRSLLDEIKSVSKVPNGRVNDKCCLVKVY